MAMAPTSAKYILNVSVNVPCVVNCPPYGWPVREPPLVNDYVDNWNGGCNTLGAPFQYLWGDNNGELTLVRRERLVPA